MNSEPPPSASVRLVVIDESHDGQRIDNYLLRELKGVPKSRIYRLLRKGEVRVNKSRIKPDFKLSSGDTVRIPPVRLPGVSGSAVPVSEGLSAALAKAILYEDEGLLIVDKPSGLAVHGGSGINLGLIEALRQLRPQQRFLELVHRLDRDTSGCVMLAKKRSVLRELHAMLREGGVDKRYYALVWGKWPARKQQVNTALHKYVLASGERMVRIEPDGKAALTQYTVVQRLPDATLVEARPVTGRTHQIRVHCRSAGYPIVGDEKYGDQDANRIYRGRGLRRLFLHAHSLGFQLEDRRIQVEAPLPPDLQQFLGNAIN